MMLGVIKQLHGILVSTTAAVLAYVAMMGAYATSNRRDELKPSFPVLSLLVNSVHACQSESSKGSESLACQGASAHVRLMNSSRRRSVSIIVAKRAD
jgi:hypothetical protein